MYFVTCKGRGREEGVSEAVIFIRLGRPYQVASPTHLAARQLAALAGLGALRHLDLDLVRVREVVGRDAEAARRHLERPFSSIDRLGD